MGNFVAFYIAFKKRRRKIFTWKNVLYYFTLIPNIGDQFREMPLMSPKSPAFSAARLLESWWSRASIRSTLTLGVTTGRVLCRDGFTALTEFHALPPRFSIILI